MYKMRRHRLPVSLLTLTALLVELFSSVVWAGMFPHRDSDQIVVAMSQHQVATHEPCAAGMSGEAGATQAPDIPAGHRCDNCGDGVCHMLTCVPVIPVVVTATIASRDTGFPSCTVRGYINRATESLYRPPAVSL